MSPSGPFVHSVGVRYYRISVYFSRPLEINLIVHKEKWTFKLAKMIGISKRTDFQVGHNDFDSMYIVEGDSKDSVVNILSEEVADKLVNFRRGQDAIVEKSDAFELDDRGIFYFEGPYSGKQSLDLREASSAVVKKMLGIASLIKKRAL